MNTKKFQEKCKGAPTQIEHAPKIDHYSNFWIVLELAEDLAMKCGKLLTLSNLSEGGWEIAQDNISGQQATVTSAKLSVGNPHLT